MKIQTLVVGLAALVAVLPAALTAQSGTGERELLPRTQENLITFKLLRMTQVLELTPDQTSKIYPVVTRLEKEKYEIIWRKLNVRMRELRLLLRVQKPDEAKIPVLVDEIAALRTAVREKDNEIDSFLRSHLSLVQYAKYTLFLMDFYRGLGEKLGQARGMMQKQAPNKRRLEPPGGDR